MHRYRAFGLQIESEWNLPELAPAPDLDHWDPDLTIVVRDLGRKMPTVTEPPIFDYGDDEVVMIWPQVGGFRIRMPATIEVEPSALAKPELIAFPLLGPVMGWFLHLRGQAILHASAVYWRGRVLGFLGDKMAGKSTTAAAFLRDGGHLITDDMLVFDMKDIASPIVLPAFAQLKLSEEAAMAVEVDGATALPNIMEGFPKRQHRLAQRALEIPERFDALFVLSRSTDESNIAWLDQAEALTKIVRYSYSTRFANAPLAMQDRGRQFRHFAALARAIRVAELKVPHDLSGLGQTVELVGQSLGVDK